MTNLNLNTKDTLILVYGKKSVAVSFRFSMLWFSTSKYSTRTAKYNLYLSRFQQNLLGKIRNELITSYTDNNVIPKPPQNVLNFLWVYDFPMFTMDEDTQQLESTHHPFTAPHLEDLELLNAKTDLENIRSQAYDLVLNGQEIGGGSIRIHNANLQKMVLEDILGINYNHLAHMLEALDSGCPPHGGLALGEFLPVGEVQ